MKFHAAVVKPTQEFTTDYKLHFFLSKLELVKFLKMENENKKTHIPILVVQHHTSHKLKTGNVLVNPNDSKYSLSYLHVYI